MRTAHHSFVKGGPWLSLLLVVAACIVAHSSVGQETALKSDIQIRLASDGKSLGSRQKVVDTPWTVPVIVSVPKPESEAKPPPKPELPADPQAGSKPKAGGKTRSPAGLKTNAQPATVVPSTEVAAPASQPEPKFTRSIYGTLLDADGALAGVLDLEIGKKSAAEGVEFTASSFEKLGLLKILAFAANPKPPLTASLIDDKGGSILTFDVERSTRLSVMIDGGNAAITRKTQLLKYVAEFPITAGTVFGPKDLKLSISPLVNDRGEKDKGVTWTFHDRVGKETAAKDGVLALVLSSAGTDWLRVKADNLLPGKHTCVLTLEHQDQREARVLTIERQDSPQSFKVLEVGSVQSAEGDPVEVHFTVVESKGAGIEIRRPDLLSLAHAEDTQSGLQTAVTGTVTNKDGGSLAERLELEPYGLKHLKMSLPGLLYGKYKGRIYVGSKDALAQEAEFTVQVRQTWWLAAGLIGAGVLISMGIRALLERRRPLLVLRHDLSALKDDLDEAVTALKRQLRLDETDTEVLGGLEKQCDELSQRIETDGRIKAGELSAREGDLKTLGARIPIFAAWVKARHRVQGLSQRLTKKREFETVVNTAHRWLGNPRATPEEGDVIRGSLDGLEPLIMQALFEDLDSKVQGLLAQMEGRQIKNEARLARLLALRDRAKAIGDGRLEDEQLRYDRARTEFAALLAEDLIEAVAGSPPTIPAPPSAPGFTTETEWTLLKDRVVTLAKAAMETPPDQPADAERSYQQACGIYVSSAAEHLLQAANALASDPALAAQTVTEAFVVALSDVKKAEEKVRIAVLTLDLVTAGKEHEAMLRAYRALEKAAQPDRPGPESVGFGATASPAANPSEPTLPGAVPGLSQVRGPAIRSMRRRSLQSAADLEAQILFQDRIVNLVLFLIAVATGLATLWVKQPAWGGPLDWLVALVWGLGLHGAAFTSLAGLRKRFLDDS